jgi:Rrf2 family transcriptional regulator, iron-sulfur cluster assembly transcription factor
MLSRTALYALQATLHLAHQPNGTPVAASVIARELEIPANYLAKVLHRLAREGVLESVRGAHGGYRLSRDPRSLTVARVVAPFDEFRPGTVCLMGGRPCDPAHPCPAHDRWARWTGVARGMLEETTVAELLAPDPDTSNQTASR